MKSITRRELLRGMLAAPALSLFPSLAWPGSEPFPQASGAPFQRVNVLFHGLSVIDFATDEVRVYLPEAGSGRAYLAGTWMQEQPLRHGERYRLTGVMTGSRPQLSTLDPKQNAVFRRSVVDLSASYCTLIFPFPDFVTPLRPLHKEHGKSFFTGSPAPVVEPVTLPQVVAFSYLHPDFTLPLQLHPSGWTPVIEEGVVNLHIWDAPAKTPSPQASIEAFERMAKMIGAPKLQIDSVYGEIKLPRPSNQLMLDGVSCQEEWTLVERTNDPEGCGKHSKYHAKDDSGVNCLSIFLY